ncbi:hypothetical protein ALNOE001_05290 [Candidatus Methanobinarius endosymbioticus]|uniref:Uncharacterized protein n=1 Tax=Candidatus Methanobinarius endosymbioticus TaxID=2006182 RepID=A0A366MEU6_9EURY|nr:hypothetical protein ALNOE001_05290 [Candidatus Methanobinarius endosymbioticus]
MYNTGINTTANLNWWGVNNITGQYENFGENLNLSTWYVIHLSANEVTTTCNASKNCTIGEMVNLTYILTTNDYSNHNPSLLPYFEVTVLSSLGHNITADIREYGLSILVCSNDSSLVESGLENFTLDYMRSFCDDEDIKLDLLMETEDIPSPEPEPQPIPNPEPIDPRPDPTPIPVPNPTPKPTDEANENYSGNGPVKASAAMKPTGMPVLAILLVLLTSLGLVLRKKQ